MNEIVIASTATTDRLDKVYILLNSIKQNKMVDTKVIYHLFIQFNNQYNGEYCKNYFDALCSSDFNIILQDTTIFKNSIVTDGKPYIYFIRCLFPTFFPNLNRLMYLDVDAVFVKQGLEDFWNIDINDYYVGAVIDPTWQYCPDYKEDPINTGTKNYFNDGIMLMNLAKMREDGKDVEFKHWCLYWDESKLKRVCIDQTLVNYLLKDKVKLIPSKYNNSVLASLGVAKEWYDYCAKQEGYENGLDSILDAVVYHFCGANKPWGDSLKIGKKDYPYKLIALPIWTELYEKYKKS